MKRYTAKAFLPEASELNDQCYEVGCRLFKGGKYRQAIKAFESALAYWPNDGQAWMALGNCHDELKRPNDAERCFRRALRYCRVVDRNAILFNLGNSLLDQGRYRAAIETYDDIPTASDLSVKAIVNKGIAEKSLISRRGDKTR